MSKRLLLKKRLQFARYYPNVWILAQGYEWVKQNLFLPCMFFKKELSDKSLRSSELQMLYDCSLILSDISYILKSYLTAFHWISLAYSIDIYSSEVVEDMVFLAKITGNTEHIKEYIQQYMVISSDHKMSDLRIDHQEADKKQIQYLHQLNMYQVGQAAKKISVEKNGNLQFIKMIAYCLSGKREQFWKQFQCYLESGGKLSTEHLYYLPVSILDSPVFWNLVIKNNTSMTLYGNDLRSMQTNFIQTKSDRNNFIIGYESYASQLHLARSSQNLGVIKDMANTFPQWKDPVFCLKFFNRCGRLPSWREFFFNADFSSRGFLITNYKIKKL